MMKAYDYCVDKGANNVAGDHSALPFQEWLKQLCTVQPQADFWFKSMEKDLLILLMLVH